MRNDAFQAEIKANPGIAGNPKLIQETWAATDPKASDEAKFVHKKQVETLDKENRLMTADEIAAAKKEWAEAQYAGRYGKFGGAPTCERAIVVRTGEIMDEHPEMSKRDAEDQAAREIARARAKPETVPTLSDDAAGMLADMAIRMGPRSVSGFLGYGDQGRANKQKVLEVMASKTEGMQPEERTKLLTNFQSEMAYARTGGSYAARVDTATQELVVLVPQALETSRKVPRGAFTALNSLVNEFRSGVSDPEFYDWQLANVSMINAYARAMNPTGVPRVTEKFELKAQNILSLATDDKSYEKQARRLMLEAQASQLASHAVMTRSAEPLTSGSVERMFTPNSVAVGPNTKNDPEGTPYQKDGWFWEKRDDKLVPVSPIGK